MIEFKYILSTIGITILIGILMIMIYIIRSTIPKGPYTWISNLCNFTLFLIAILCLFFGLVHSSPSDLRDGANPPKALDFISDMKLELRSVFSDYISKYAMFPLLVVEMIIVVSLNGYLLWIWFSTGQVDTIVNKFIFIQRFAIISYIIGCVIDYWLRLYGLESFTFMSADTYCSCWIIFYKTIFYGCSMSLFSAAVIRFICVEYPIEYHIKLGFIFVSSGFNH